MMKMEQAYPGVICLANIHRWCGKSPPEELVNREKMHLPFKLLRVGISGILILCCLPSIVGTAPASVNLSTTPSVEDAMALLTSLGVPKENLCSVSSDQEGSLLPPCRSVKSQPEYKWVRSRRQRYLQEEVEKPAMVWADKNLLLRVFNNLIKNANFKENILRIILSEFEIFLAFCFYTVRIPIFLIYTFFGK